MDYSGSGNSGNSIKTQGGKIVETIIVFSVLGWFGYKIDSDAKFRRKVKNVLRGNWSVLNETNKRKNKTNK